MLYPLKIKIIWYNIGIDKITSVKEITKNILKKMNIIILILSSIDISLIYINDYINSMLIGEIIFDILGGLFSFFVLNFLYSRNEKVVAILRYILLFFSFFILIILIVCFIKRDFNRLSNRLSPFIPFTLAYFGIVIRKKLEDKYII